MSCSSRSFRVSSSNLFRRSLHRWPALLFELVLTLRGRLAVFLKTILSCLSFKCSFSSSRSCLNHLRSVIIDSSFWLRLFSTELISILSGPSLLTFSLSVSILFHQGLFHYFPLIYFVFLFFHYVSTSSMPSRFHSFIHWWVSLRSFSFSSINSVPSFKRSTATHSSSGLSLRCRNHEDFLLTIDPNGLVVEFLFSTRLFGFSSNNQSERFPFPLVTFFGPLCQDHQSFELVSPSFKPSPFSSNNCPQSSL